MQTHPKSKIHYILVASMLGGIPAAVIYSFSMNFIASAPFMKFFPPSLIAFVSLGAISGYRMWKSSVRERSREIEPLTCDEKQDLESGATLVIWTRNHKMIAWMGVIITAFLTVFSAFVGQYIFTIIILVLFLVPNVLFLLYCGKIEMDMRSIRHICSYGVFEIAWDEITHVRRATQGTALLFCSDNKRLPVPSPGSWSGVDKRLMRTFMENQVSNRDIPVLDDWFAGHKFPKNVRVSRQAGTVG